VAYLFHPVTQYPNSRIQFYASSQPRDSQDCKTDDYYQSNYTWFSNVMQVQAHQGNSLYFAPAAADGVIWPLNDNCDLEYRNNEKCSDGVQMSSECQSDNLDLITGVDDLPFWDQPSLNFLFLDKVNSMSWRGKRIKRYMTYDYMEEGDFELLQNRLEEFGSVYFKYYGQERESGKNKNEM